VNARDFESFAEPEPSKKNGTAKRERVCKKELRRNVFLTWSLIYSVFFCSWLGFFSVCTDISDGYVDVSVVSVRSILLTTFVLLLLPIIYYLGVFKTLREGSYFTAQPSDGIIFKLWSRKAYRVGRYYVGLKLQAIVGNEMWGKVISKLFKFVKDESHKRGCPIIIRSHILMVPRFRKQLTKHLDSADMIYSVSTGLPLQSTVKLKWITASVVALTGKIPTMYAHEAEIVVFPSNRTHLMPTFPDGTSKQFKRFTAL